MYDSKPYKITAIKGNMITAEREDRKNTRNLSFFKPYIRISPETQNGHKEQEAEGALDNKEGVSNGEPFDEHRTNSETTGVPT